MMKTRVQTDKHTMIHFLLVQELIYYLQSRSLYVQDILRDGTLPVESIECMYCTCRTTRYCKWV